MLEGGRDAHEMKTMSQKLAGNSFGRGGDQYLRGGDEIERDTHLPRTEVLISNGDIGLGQCFSVFVGLLLLF